MDHTNEDNPPSLVKLISLNLDRWNQIEDDQYNDKNVALSC